MPQSITEGVHSSVLRSGVLLLAEEQEALIARLALAASANETIDVQYYIWMGDAVDIAVIKQLLLAALRGVRVRLLVDDIHFVGYDRRVLGLDEQKGGQLGPRLHAMYKDYRVEEGNFEELLTKVDSVPVSLVLAQAAEESGWGTSRFAAFESPLDSVVAYMRNINSHPAYQELTGPYYPSYGHYYGGYNNTVTMVRDPYVDTRTTVILVTTIYDAKTSEPVWVGRSSTFEPGSVAYLAGDIARSTWKNISR